MPSYAEAENAIEQRLRDNWTATPIAFLNEAPPSLENEDTQQPVAAWVFCEVAQTQVVIVGVGKPEENVLLADGLINLTVFVPSGSGRWLQRQYLEQLGEIFKKQRFYTDTPMHEVRTWIPRLSGGDSKSDDGIWFGRTVVTPFEYWHLG